MNGHTIQTLETFVIFDLPKKEQGLGVLWSYRRILEGVQKVLKDKKIKRIDDVKTMRQYIGNLVGSNQPLSKKSLNSIITKKPNWKPLKKDLSQLKKAVNGMNGKPQQKPNSNGDLDLEIVVWTFLNNLAQLMKELNAVAKKHLEEDKSSPDSDIKGQ